MIITSISFYLLYIDNYNPPAPASIFLKQMPSTYLTPQNPFGNNVSPNMYPTTAMQAQYASAGFTKV